MPNPIINANKILFRPSSLGDLMSGVKKGWSVDKSLTCKKKLIELYNEIRYSRTVDQKKNKYTEKGTLQEPDAITLYSLYKGEYFVKNTERLKNDFFSGEPDIVKKNKDTIDTKCAWSIFTLPDPLTEDANDDYVYQGCGYLDLTGGEIHTIAHGLVNSPSKQVLKAKEFLYYEMDCPDDTNEDFMAKKIQIEKNMIFDMAQFKRDNPHFDIECTDWNFDIPIAERVVEFEVKRDQALIDSIKTRLTECREWLNKNKFKI